MPTTVRLRYVKSKGMQLVLFGVLSLGLAITSVAARTQRAYAVDYGCFSANPGIFEFPILDIDPALKDSIAVGIAPGVDDFRDFPLPAGDVLKAGDYRVYMLLGDDHFLYQRDPAAPLGPYPRYDYKPWFELGPMPIGYLNGGWPGQFGATIVGWHNQLSEQLFVALDSSNWAATTTPYTNPDYGFPPTPAYDNNSEQNRDFNDLYDYIGSGRDITGAIIPIGAYPGNIKTGTYGAHNADFVMYQEYDNDWQNAPVVPYPPEVNQDRGFDLGTVTLPSDSTSIRIRHIRDVLPAQTQNGAQSVQPIRLNIECVSAGPPSAIDQGYIEVENGSVWAGGNFDNAATGFGSGWCDVSTGSSADGFIRAANDGTLGSYASYIVGATGNISQFGSITVALQRLMMANSGTSGNFNSQGQCITDLYTYLSKNPGFAPQIQNVAGFPPGANRQGQYVVSGNLNINAAQQLSAGEKITLIVDGDVNINANITYDPAYIAADSSDIPVLIIIARGDINIASNVTQLDGLYMARPADPTNAASLDGVIDTCYNAPADGRLYNVDATSTPEECDQQLVVRGMFIANDIQFRRTHGGIDGEYGPQAPAEYFQFNSELYLSKPLLISEFEPDLEIQSIRDLPPVIN